MKTFLLSLLILVISITMGFAQEVATIQISPADTTIKIGDEIKFIATAYDTSNSIVNAEIIWSVGEGIGEIDQEGEFTATTAGTGAVTATVGDISSDVEVTVTEEEESGEEEPGSDPAIVSIKLYPDSTTIRVGETIQFEVGAKDSLDEEVEIENVEWSISNPEIGSIDSSGHFTANAEGETQVTATVGNLTATSIVVVLGEITLPDSVNTITLQRQHPDGKITQFGAPIIEGNSITLGGMPFPFNYLNGGVLYFPENCVENDIVITIKLPSCAKLNEKTKEIDFDLENEVISVVTFEVSVDGEPIHPFPFNPNIILTLPYKRGLLTKLGIEPEDLSFYFVNEGQLVAEGLGNIEVDLEENTITGNIAHFSDIAVAPRSETTVKENKLQPSEFTLSNNYPNPFNPETTISYSLSKSSFVSISIYNVVGQRVRTLVETVKLSGAYSIKWDGKDDSGAKLTSGLYLYRMKADDFSQTKKLMLMK